MTRALFLEAPATSRGPLPWLLALGAGLAQAASLAWPGPGSLAGQPLWWLQILSLAVLGRAAAWRRLGAACGSAGLGVCHGLAGGTFWWLFISMHTYGGLAAPLAVLAVLGLAAFLGGYYAIASWCFWALRPKGRALQAIVFAALWLLAELARGVLWTGFPCGAGGYAHTDGPLAALARWVGVYGVGALAAALAMSLAQVRPADVLRARAWLGAGALAPAVDEIALRRALAVHRAAVGLQAQKAVLHVLLGVRGHEGAAALAAHQQVFGRQFVDGLAHRALADAQRFGQRPLAGQGLVRRPFALRNALREQRAYLLVQRLKTGLVRCHRRVFTPFCQGCPCMSYIRHNTNTILLFAHGKSGGFSVTLGPACDGHRRRAAHLTPTRRPAPAASCLAQHAKSRSVYKWRVNR